MKKVEKIVIEEKTEYNYEVITFEKAINMFLNKEAANKELLCISIDDREIWDFDDASMSDFRDKEIFFVKRMANEN